MGFLSVLRGLSVVLPVLISTMAMMMLASAMNNFVIQKCCSPEDVPENINEFICHNTTVFDYANEILSTAAGIKSACSGLSSFAFGILRDVTGKSKILMFVGVIAELISVTSFFLSALYWRTSAWLPALTSTFVAGGFGENVMQLGATCFLIQESSPEELPLRLQVYMSSTLVLMLVGGTTTTMILTTFGYRWLFTVCIGLQLIAFLLVIILVKEKGANTKSLQESLGGLKTVFKWRENVIVLWLMLIAGPLPIFLFTAEGIDTTLFLQQQLGFSMNQSTIYNSYHFVITIIGSLAGPYILRKVFHCSHLSIGLIASIANAGAAVAYTFIKTTLSLYLMSWLCFLRLAVLPLPNTVISTILKNHELGTYLGMAAILTVGIPFGVTRAYRAVFSNTKESWIGAFYFVSAAIFGVLAILYSVSYCLYIPPKKPVKSESKEDLEKNEENGISSLPETTDI